MNPRFRLVALGNFDQDRLVLTGSILRAWLESLRLPLEVPDYYGPGAERTGSYDYVLVDSRTGISEVGGLCIGPLSDQLVVFTALNDQNVEGTRRFLVEVGILEGPAAPSPDSSAVRRNGAKPTMIVASLVPVGEIEMKRKRLERLEQALGKVIVKLSYHPQMALIESIFTRDYHDEYLACEYNRIIMTILRSEIGGEVDDLDEVLLHQSPSKPEFRDAIRRLVRATRSSRSENRLRYHLYRLNPINLNEDVDFILWDQVCRVLSGRQSSARHAVINDWANLLTAWGLRTKDSVLAALRFQAAERYYSSILDSSMTPAQYKPHTLISRGTAYSRRGEWEKAEADYTTMLAMPVITDELRARGLLKRGIAYGGRGEWEKAEADYTTVLAMPGITDELRAQGLVN
jgi:tetratricopeptide (TPR) repeat protein